MALSIEQKKILLIQYFKNELTGKTNNQLINDILRAANFPLELDEKESDNLLKNIVSQIPGNECYGLLHEIYAELNEEFTFDSSNKNSANMCFALQALASQYESSELQQSEAQAQQDTRSFCRGVVTIPFASLYYRSQLKKHYQEQNFQRLFIDAQDVKLLRERPGHEDHMFGLLNKNAINSQKEFKKEFKTVLFSNKGQVRKFMPTSEHGFFGRYGINMLGTKEQIHALKQKLEGLRRPPRA